MKLRARDLCRPDNVSLAIEDYCDDCPEREKVCGECDGTGVYSASHGAPLTTNSECPACRGTRTVPCTDDPSACRESRAMDAAEMRLEER